MNKVSIVMPVYNVENYVEKSIRSVIAQTYKDWELIVINDGSTDNSLNICKKIAKTDSRIRIISQENKGLSGACNTGLSATTGIYLCSVDSDDYIEPNMIELMVEAIERTASDICICDYYFNHGDKSEVVNGYKSEQILTKENALIDLLVNKHIQSYRWNKLFKVENMKGIVFPEGKTFEDLFTMHEIFDLADQIVIIPKALYHYVQRNGSILNGGGGNQYHVFEAFKTQLSYIKIHHPNLSYLSYANCISQVINLIVSCDETSKKELQLFIYGELKSIINCKNLSVSFKIKAVGIILFPNILVKFLKIEEND